MVDADKLSAKCCERKDLRTNVSRYQKGQVMHESHFSLARIFHKISILIFINGARVLYCTVLYQEPPPTSLLLPRPFDLDFKIAKRLPLASHKIHQPSSDLLPRFINIPSRVPIINSQEMASFLARH